LKLTQVSDRFVERTRRDEPQRQRLDAAGGEQRARPNRASPNCRPQREHDGVGADLALET